MKQKKNTQKNLYLALLEQETEYEWMGRNFWILHFSFLSPGLGKQLEQFYSEAPS